MAGLGQVVTTDFLKGGQLSACAVHSSVEYPSVPMFVLQYQHTTQAVSKDSLCGETIKKAFEFV